MFPHRFRPWAEEVFRQSPAIASVEAVKDERAGHEALTHTHVTLATGARIVLSWVGGDPIGRARPLDFVADKAITGPSPEPVKVPELSTSGRLKTVDIEAHLVALLTNGAHEEVESVHRRSQAPPFYADDPKAGIGIRCHSGATITGIFLHSLSRGQQPTKETEYKKREEV